MAETTGIAYTTVEDSKALPGQMVEIVPLGYMIRLIFIVGRIPMGVVQILGYVLKAGKATMGGSKIMLHSSGGARGRALRTKAKDHDPPKGSPSRPSRQRTQRTWATQRVRTFGRLRFGSVLQGYLRVSSGRQALDSC